MISLSGYSTKECIAMTPNDQAYTWWSCHSGLANCCANCIDASPIYRFLASRPCGPTGWLALLLIKTGDVETNPDPTTTRKQVWICDICHRQIHGRKQILLW